MRKSSIAVVTGGAGFIGSHTVDVLLENGYQVRVIDSLVGGREQNLGHHSRNPDLTVEFRDIRTIKANDPLFSSAALVFHFAGIGDIVPSVENPLEYLSVNAQGTIHVLEAARSAAVRKLVYAASSSCYGITKELPTTEDAPIYPEYPYALSKYQAEQSVFHWSKVYRLPVNVIRIFNAYGTRSRTSGAYGAVFGVFLKQKLEGRSFTVVGDGSQKRDFVYVTDVAKAFFLAATTHHIGEVYNVGGGNPQSINRIVELLGSHGVEHLPKRPGEPDCTWADITKIKRDLGWSPKVSLEQGIQELLRNIEYWREAPLWDRDSIAQATAAWFQSLTGRRG